MRILILGLNYAPEKVGIAVYTTGMAEALVKMGHEVRIIAGQPYYPGWKIMEGHHAFAFTSQSQEGVFITRVPHYVPSHPTGTKRILHHLSFVLTSFFPLLFRAFTWRPDAIVAIAPSLIAAPSARLAARICGAISWLHIQDFEVEAATATNLLRPGTKINQAARYFEQWVLSQYDRVSTISPQMCRKLFEKGVPRERIVEFRNWADISNVKPLATRSSYRERWGIETPNVALYSGNIGNKQGIEIIVDAARILQHRRDLTFVICGEGPNRANLESRARGLANVQFHDLQPKDHLNDLLGLATIHLLPQVAEAADLVLPSKLANMLASGRPVVATAASGTGLAEEVEGSGLVTAPGDPFAFSTAICQLLDNPEHYKRFKDSALVRAKGHWSSESILQSFADALENSVRTK